MYNVDLSSLFVWDKPIKPTIEILQRPTNAEALLNPALMDIYQLKLKEYIKDKKNLNVSMKSLWAVIWGQCTNLIQTKLEKKKDIEEIKQKGDIVTLLTYIQQACMTFKYKHQLCVTLHQ